MSTTEIGALIVTLRTDSAEFRAEMDKARTGMKNVGTQADASSRQIAKLASQGFGAVLPISFQAEHAIERFIEKSLGAAGALGLAAKGALAFGVALAAFKLGEHIGQMLSLGTTLEKYDEQVKKATETERKFLEQIQKRAAGLRDLQKELASVRGDESKVAEQAQEQRDAAIRARTRPDAERDRQLAISAQIRLEQEQKFLGEQQKLRDDFAQKALDDLQKERAEQVKSWEAETKFYSDSLKQRLQMRNDFLAALGTGGFEDTSAAGGFAALDKLRKQTETEARQLAFLEREGSVSQTTVIQERQRIQTRAMEQAEQLRAKFAQFPEVIDAINRSMVQIDFGNFGTDMDKAREAITRLVPTVDSLLQQQGQLAAQFATLPAGIDPASTALRQLSADYINLANAIYAAATAQTALMGVAPSTAPTPPAVPVE